MATFNKTSLLMVEGWILRYIKRLPTSQHHHTRIINFRNDRSQPSDTLLQEGGSGNESGYSW